VTRKHLLDTDLYIDLIQSGKTLPIIAELYAKETPGIHFSSVVAQELMAGARSASGRKHIKALLAPFEKADRIVTPTHRQWKETGDILATILARHPNLKTKLPGLVNDCLLALSALGIGATLYTRNRKDFLLLNTIRAFSVVVID
jgi:predicted nucleic acid-binding protein